MRRQLVIPSMAFDSSSNIMCQGRLSLLVNGNIQNDWYSFVLSFSRGAHMLLVRQKEKWVSGPE